MFLSHLRKNFALNLRIIFQKIFATIKFRISENYGYKKITQGENSDNRNFPLWNILIIRKLYRMNILIIIKFKQSENY